MANTRSTEERDISGPPVVADDAGAACRNCGAPTRGAYCGQCGQETAARLPSVGTFLRDAAGRYVALDGRLWRTLFALIARPGFLTLEYFAGRRRRYIRPARLFLVLYLLLFALVGLLQSPAELSRNIAFVSSEESASISAKRGAEDTFWIERSAEGRNGSGPARTDGTESAVERALAEAAGAGADSGDDYNVNIRAGDIVRRLPVTLQSRYERFKELPNAKKSEQVYAGFLRYGPYAIVALLPVFALLLKLAYLGRGRRYPGRPSLYVEHLIYAAHMHAFVAVMLLLMVLAPYDWMSLPLLLWAVVYAFVARQRVYRGRWWGGLLRGFFIATAYAVLLSIAVAGLLAVSVVLR